MTSTTGNNKTTPIVLISTANPASPSAYKGADSANASPITPFLLRPAAGPGLGCSRDLPGFFDPGSTPAAHETLRAPVGLHRQLPQERDATHLLRISFQDVERDLQEAKAEAGTYATELADSEHRQHHDMLVRNATTITTSVHHTEATITTLTQDTRECRSRLGVLQVQEGSVAAAVEASSRTHQSFTAGFGTHPWTQHPGAASPAKMAPPPTRTPQASAPVQIGQQHAIVDTRLTQAPPADGQNHPTLRPRSPLGDPNHTPTFLWTIPTYASECRACGTTTTVSSSPRGTPFLTWPQRRTPFWSLWADRRSHYDSHWTWR